MPMNTYATRNIIRHVKFLSCLLRYISYVKQYREDIPGAAYFHYVYSGMHHCLASRIKGDNAVADWCQVGWWRMMSLFGFRNRQFKFCALQFIQATRQQNLVTGCKRKLRAT